MDIDKPLDEIIASKPKTRRGRGPARGAGAAGGRAAPAAGAAGNNARARYAGNAPRAAGPAATAAAAAKPIAGEATKIIISNLPGDVTEAAVRDLMQSTVGPVKSVQMSYNAQGKTTGVATVLFRNKGDAHKAHASYNNRMIDNQRPMKVEIAVDPATLVSLASRVGPAPQAARGAARGAAANAAPRRGGRGGAGGRARAPRPKPKTADELDADMDSWKEKPAA